MNRIIKFRAYWKDRVPQLGICEVVEIDFRENTACISNGAVMVFPKLDEIQLIQYTGLKDENNKEIYEGDIVTRYIGSGKYSNYQVSFKDGGFFIGYGQIRDFNTDSKVIGNIFENPELLKG